MGALADCDDEGDCEAGPVAAAGFPIIPPVPSPLVGLTALDNSRIEIYGRDLESVLVDPNYEDGLYSLYQLTGSLADGTILLGNTVLVQNGTGAGFELFEIPEPSSVVLLIGLVTLSCIVLRKRVPMPA